MMKENPQQPALLLIGKDSALEYLFTRYAEQMEMQIIFRDAPPGFEDLKNDWLLAVIFTAIDELQANQPFVDEMNLLEIPVFVCSAVADQAHARELGADGCLTHPLTYNQFSTSISTGKTLAEM